MTKLNIHEVFEMLPTERSIKIRQGGKHHPASWEVAMEVLPAWGRYFTLRQDGEVFSLFDHRGESDLPLMIW